jgi:hypothetical protein
MPVTIILRGLDFALLSCCPIQVIEVNQVIHASKLASAVREAVTGLVSTTRSSHSEGESSAAQASGPSVAFNGLSTVYPVTRLPVASRIAH